MNAHCQKTVFAVKDRGGFTLIEMLIVIIILGILAMVIIPQITVSQDDAKISTLKTNLGGIRSAIELYYTQHNNTYPGVKKVDGTGADVADAAESKTAFEAQMFQYTDATGKTATTYNATTAPFGPYIKGGALPANPFEDLATNTTVLCDVTETDITKSMGVKRVADGTTGYKYLAKLGVVFANDEVSAADDTKPHKQY
ncbi:MAG: prepilin-type N-terminal cleavage/methylation domain-containing protein [Proteobacteria bacterium]|nr:prepilin-type N-terminal cleavage/methylation domain-containing protein [Pseudomonadota bacterium]